MAVDFRHWCLANGNILLDWACIAPSPSKDYCQVVVTTQKVIYRCWKVSLRTNTKTTPVEITQHYADFLDDDRVQSELCRVFGAHLLTYVKQLARGQIDYISRLSNDLLVNIIKVLPLEDINSLSQTSKQFNALCASEDLWRAVYLQHGGLTTTSQDLELLASNIGWRKLFFTNKLQLQVQLRRQSRRRTPDNYNKDDDVSSMGDSPYPDNIQRSDLLESPNSTTSPTPLSPAWGDVSSQPPSRADMASLSDVRAALYDDAVRTSPEDTPTLSPDLYHVEYQNGYEDEEQEEEEEEEDEGEDGDDLSDADSPIVENGR